MNLPNNDNPKPIQAGDYGKPVTKPAGPKLKSAIKITDGRKTLKLWS